MEGKWEYDAFHLYSSVEPIFVASIQGQYDIWYDVIERYPSPKQIAAWNDFCALSPCDLLKQLTLGLAAFVNQMNTRLKNIDQLYLSTYNPKIVKKSVRKTIFNLQKSGLPLGKNEPSVFRCDSFVIPRQENSPAQFVLMHFELGAGKIPDQTFGVEMEGLFCNGLLLFVGVDSGLWTRVEWEEEFNTPLFEATAAHYPYWE